MFWSVLEEKPHLIAEIYLLDLFTYLGSFFGGKNPVLQPLKYGLYSFLTYVQFRNSCHCYSSISVSVEVGIHI